MLGILLIYFIGKNFYELAGKYGKHQWGFAIAGVLSYYLGTFLGGLVIGFYFFMMDSFVEDSNRFVLNLIAVPFGILACMGLYRFLKYVWQREAVSVNSDILDENVIE